MLGDIGRIKEGNLRITSLPSGLKCIASLKMKEIPLSLIAQPAHSSALLAEILVLLSVSPMSQNVKET